MPLISLETIIHADVQVVFDLSRSIDFHKISAKQTKEEAVGGVTNGLINLSESVTWRAKHFGIYHLLTSKIIEMNTYNSFTDVMVEGIFKRFSHQHVFEKYNKGTKMFDYFDYTAPLGYLGSLADSMFLKNYMKRFLEQRNQQIKACAESELWKSILE
jgi:ligand-binding SRPBCC domain-containing protein